MNKQDLLNNLNRRDLPGVGCVVYNTDGRKTYYFYEDFSPADLGIDRAERQFADLIEKGYVRRVEYIYKEQQEHKAERAERRGYDGRLIL